MTRQRAGGSAVLTVAGRSNRRVADIHLIQVTAMQHQDAASTMLSLIRLGPAQTPMPAATPQHSPSGSQPSRRGCSARPSIAMPVAEKGTEGQGFLWGGRDSTPNASSWLRSRFHGAVPAPRRESSNSPSHRSKREYDSHSPQLEISAQIDAEFTRDGVSFSCRMAHEHGFYLRLEPIISTSRRNIFRSARS